MARLKPDRSPAYHTSSTRKSRFSNIRNPKTSPCSVINKHAAYYIVIVVVVVVVVIGGVSWRRASTLFQSVMTVWYGTSYDAFGSGRVPERAAARQDVVPREPATRARRAPIKQDDRARKNIQHAEKQDSGHLVLRRVAVMRRSRFLICTAWGCFREKQRIKA